MRLSLMHARFVHVRAPMWMRATAVATLACTTVAAQAQFTTRYHAIVNGSFETVGNTSGQDVAPGVPLPITGTIGPVGANTADSAPDIFWVSDSPSPGQATANAGVTAAQARSTAIFGVPPIATIAYARLYWAARGAGSGADSTVELSRVGTGSFTQVVTADATMTLSGDRYQGTADVTSIVQARGVGGYQLSGIDSVELTDRDDSGAFVAWAMFIVYQLPGSPSREVIIADQFQEVAPGSPAVANLALFGAVPPAGTSKLGVIAYEGDTTISGDTLTVNGSPVSDALNPISNVFNSTRSFLGVPNPNTGDLPRLTGTPGSMCGLDIDQFDTTLMMPSGSTALSATFATTSDTFIIGAVALAAGSDATCQAPTVTAQPQPASRCAGESVQFAVQAGGTGPFNYQWRKSGSPLAAQRGISGVATPTLLIEGLLLADQASYDCVITGACGNITSDAAALTVTTCCGPDYNRSGVVSVQDIFDFLAAYFAGCP